MPFPFGIFAGTRLNSTIHSYKPAARETLVPGKDQYDVIIVGGSVGGCVLALSYARHNLRIALLEQKPVTSDYKKLCTHFIQPMALPVLRGLGLDEAMESAGAIPTKAAFWTPVGWIDPLGDYGGDASTAYAYNM